MRYGVGAAKCNLVHGLKWLTIFSICDSVWYKRLIMVNLRVELFITISDSVSFMILLNMCMPYM